MAKMKKCEVCKEKSGKFSTRFMAAILLSPAMIRALTGCSVESRLSPTEPDIARCKSAIRK